MGAEGRSTVHNSLAEQKIVGTPDMTPTAIKAEVVKSGLNVNTLSIPTCSWPDSASKVARRPAASRST